MPEIKRLKDIRAEHQLQYKHKRQNVIQPYNISQKIYNSKQWKQLRNSYITEHPLCEQCLLEDNITPAEDVHHIKPFLSGITYNEILSLAYDYNNLMSLCKQCHQ